METKGRKGGEEMLQSSGPQWVSVRRKEQRRVTVMPFPGPVHCSRETVMKKSE